MSQVASAPALLVEPLGPQQIRLAYPLMRAGDPSLELPAWLRYARRYVPAHPRRQAGILVARRPGQPFLSGLACYHRRRDPRFGWVLIMDHCAALDLLDPGAVVRALTEALDRLAGERGCAAMRLVVQDRDRDVGAGLSASGHRREAVVLVKPLDLGPAQGGSALEAALQPPGERAGPPDGAHPGG